MGIRVYVASKFELRDRVRALHDALTAAGHVPTSSWASIAGNAPEDLGGVSLAKKREALAQNDRDIEAANCVVVLAHEKGGQHFCEASAALVRHTPVIWCGREILETSRRGVHVVETVDEALDAVDILAEHASRATPEAVTAVCWDIVQSGGLRALGAA